MRTSLCLLAALSLLPAQGQAPNRSYPAVSSLLDQAKLLTGVPARVPLAARTSDADTNFALAQFRSAAKPFADLFDAVVYAGAIEPEVKLAMGLRIAQVYASPYMANQTQRRLATTERGRAILKLLGTKPIPMTGGADPLALSYAEELSLDVHGISDADFAALRPHFNDSQIVELTITSCFFNYLTRYAEALHLPVETWAFEQHTRNSTVEKPIAKVSLISDAEMEAVQALAARAARAASNAGGLGNFLPNSQRAMYLSPVAATAWNAYGGAAGQNNSVDRTLKLHISFAVSMANGCRYCTLHQVLGLRRQGVDISKLVAMEKDDSALNDRELTVVQFARKLTKAPNSVTDGDFGKLTAMFGQQGAMEIVLQTCNFAYMNRFTDNLRLPSEDEAVKVYTETYGRSAPLARR